MLAITILEKLRDGGDLTDDEVEVMRRWMKPQYAEDTEGLHDVELNELTFIMQDEHMVKRWGGEGEGDSIGFILKFGDKYVEVDAFYSSWDGPDYDEAYITEVRPVEKIITVFEAVNN